MHDCPAFRPGRRGLQPPGQRKINLALIPARLQKARRPPQEPAQGRRQLKYSTGLFDAMGPSSGSRPPKPAVPAPEKPGSGQAFTIRISDLNWRKDDEGKTSRSYDRSAPGSNRDLEPVINFPAVCVASEIGSDEAENEDFGHSKARTTTKCEPICAATLRAGANFPDFVVARR
jgi:hypothetical protein